MTKLDEMVETFGQVVQGTQEPNSGGFRNAMAAVLRKHVEPMIAEAFARGALRDGLVKVKDMYASHVHIEDKNEYAARIIAELEGKVAGE